MIGIPKEAITILSPPGRGAYGTVSKCQIKGISFFPESMSWCYKEFKGGIKSQQENFVVELSIDLPHLGIVLSIAHARSRPWMMIFPFFNGGSLGNLLEIVLYLVHFAKIVAIQDARGKDVLPTEIKAIFIEE